MEYIYHRKSIRIQKFDYSQTGMYFVTICIDGHKHLLGKVVNREMVLNNIGNIAQKCWLEIPDHFPNVELDQFIIMPNHMHGIVVINNKINPVRACHGMPLQNKFSKPISGSLGTIINQYKSSAKRQCNKNGYSYFQWQRNYYEHVHPVR